MTAPSLPAIVTTQVGQATLDTVDGRELHQALGVGRDFTNWVKDRVEAYGFVEGVDYATDLVANFGEKGQGRPRTEFRLTVDMAKELAMVERTEIGRRVRRHYIALEKRTQAAAVAAAVEQRDLSRQTNGIIRQINGRFPGLSRAVEQALALMLKQHTATPAREHRRVLEVLEEQGVPARERRALSFKLGRKLTLLSAEMHLPPMPGVETGTPYFHVRVWDEWLERRGGRIAVAEHKRAMADKPLGQRSFDLRLPAPEPVQ